MKDKKVIILIVLGIGAVISIIYGITTPAKWEARPDAAAASKSLNHVAVTRVESKAAQPAERRYKRSAYTSWKRSPFVPAGTSVSSSLVLSGIIWNKDKPKAMIGDAIVLKGDTVGGNKVVDIKPDSVILNDGTKDFELKIEK